VPTGSLEPTVLPGDFIAVNQFCYGLRLPVFNNKILNIGEPKVGDIALFRYPKDPSIIYVKRVIGTPGDHISYKNKILTINGFKAKQTSEGMSLDHVEDFSVPVQVNSETLPTVEHKVFIRDGFNQNKDFDLIVPPHQYFMMGDNRDDSDDSRSWGFVPEQNLIGKAFAIWLSWDREQNSIRFARMGKLIK
jgi:signal peptidase I